MAVSWSWEDVRYALALYREGSMERAGRVLKVNASTVSRRVGGLEEGLRVRLFERRPSGVTLTAEGRGLLEEMLSVERAVEGLERRAAASQAELSGRVCVSCAAALGRQIIAEFGPFFERFPSLQLDIQTSAELANLSQREADISVRFVPPSGAELRARRVSSYRWGVFGSAALVKSGVELSRLPWVGYAHPKQRTAMEEWFKRHIPEGQRRLLAHDMAILVEAVSSGLGLGLLPEPEVRDRSGLVEVKVPLPLPEPSPVWLVAHEDMSAIPRVRVVWDFLVELLSEGSALKGSER